MTTALGLLFAGAAVLALYGAWTNRNPWDVLLSIIRPNITVRPIAQ